MSNTIVVEPALDIARTILAGFGKHYRIFRDASIRARSLFENQQWAELKKNNRERIDFYNLRVLETVEYLTSEFPDILNEALWPQIKIEYISLLYQHRQPELAETFFNSVAAKVLKRRYYNNQHTFTSPAVAAEHIEGKQATYRCYYPLVSGLESCLRQALTDFEFGVPFSHLDVCVANLGEAIRKWLPDVQQLGPNFHIQVLVSPFYWSTSAYVVGRVVHGHVRSLFMIPLKHSKKSPGNGSSGLYADAFIHEPDDLANLMSVSHAYFMVDMEVPSSWISFISAALPDKPKSELYTAVGLQRQGKILFVRDLRQHLKHSADHFVVAPGTPGMVMLVFTMPSFPFVFKVIRDSFDPPKDTTVEEVKQKYRLIKLHDRVGRLADTLEYFDLDFPIDRVAPSLVERMKQLIPSNVEIDGGHLVIRHAYVEQRLTPLNLYLAGGDAKRLKHGAQEYGNALRDLARANIFPGDLLLKNFGVSPYGRVVFYDYDEVCLLTDCNFRAIPEAVNLEDETRSEPWYGVGANDVFPEEFAKFLFNDHDFVRQFFEKQHADLLKPSFWIETQKKIRQGEEMEFALFPKSRRFPNRMLAHPSLVR